MLNVAGPPALGQDAEAPQAEDLISITISNVSVPGFLGWLGLGIEPINACQPWGGALSQTLVPISSEQFL